MKRITELVILCGALIILGGLQPLFAQAPPFHGQISVKVSPVNFDGGCPVNLTVTATISGPQLPLAYIQFAGTPVLMRTFWLGPNQVVPLNAGSPSFTMTVPVQSGGWVQADVIKFTAGNTQPSIMASSNRVSYFVHCVTGMAPGAQPVPNPGSHPQYQGTNPNYSNLHLNPNVNVPHPASQPPQTGPALRPPPPPYAASQANQPPANFHPASTLREPPPSMNKGLPSGGTADGIRFTFKVRAGACAKRNPRPQSFVGSLYINGKGPLNNVPITYVWVRSDNAVSNPPLSANLTSAHQLNLRDEWSGAPASGWELVQVTSVNGQQVNIQSSQASFSCPAAAAASAPPR